VTATLSIILPWNASLEIASWSCYTHCVGNPNKGFVRFARIESRHGTNPCMDRVDPIPPPKPPLNPINPSPKYVSATQLIPYAEIAATPSLPCTSIALQLVSWELFHGWACFVSIPSQYKMHDIFWPRIPLGVNEGLKFGGLEILPRRVRKPWLVAIHINPCLRGIKRTNEV
jgi:hypothetical protein